MAITTVGGSLSVSAGFSESISGLIPAQNINSAVSFSAQFGTGTGANNFDLPAYRVAAGALGTSASTTLDLTSYTAVDGSTVTTMTKLKFFWIKNTGTVAIDIGGAAATQLIGTGFLKGATDILTLGAGQVFCLCLTDGMTVSGTVKSLKILNTSGATAAAYELLIIGSSA